MGCSLPHRGQTLGLKEFPLQLPVFGDIPDDGREGNSIFHLQKGEAEVNGEFLTIFPKSR